MAREERSSPPRDPRKPSELRRVGAPGGVAPASAAELVRSDDAPAALAVEPDGSTVPLWGLSETVPARLSDLRGPPYELLDAVEGLEVAKIEIGKARDLTDPLDLVRENFPYLQ